MSVDSPPRVAAAAGSVESASREAVAAPVIVLGGGPIGMLCALLLARGGVASVLVDARPVESLVQDRRLLALSQGSLQTLESVLGANFAPLAPIERVLVSSQGEFGNARLTSEDFGGAPLGATVWFSELVRALSRRVQDQGLVRSLRPRRAVEVMQHPDGVRVRLDDGTLLEGELCVDAEGTPGLTRAASHHALLAELAVELDRPGDAVERFTREGPLALLPVPGAGNLMSMIWCLPTELARARMALPANELLGLVTRALGARVAPPAAIGPVHAFALHTHRVPRVCEHRLVHLGNAAQTLHPVAGQGFNLGIRDCVSLTDCVGACLSAQGRTPTRAGALAQALREYAQRRRVDRRLLPSLTSALPRVFSPSLPNPVAALRSAALVTIDLVPPLRREFARLLMFGPERS